MGTNLEGGRCDGSEEGGTTSAEEGRAGRRRPPRRRRRLRPQAKGSTASQGSRRPRRPAGAPGRPPRRRPRLPRRAHAAKKAAPAPRRRAAAKKAAPRPRRPPPRGRRRRAPTKKAAAGQEGGHRSGAPRSGRRSAPTPRSAKFLDEQRAAAARGAAIYAGQAVDLRAEADSLALEREPGDVQFDEESGEGGTVTVDRERNLALSAQASAAVEEIDDALRKIERKSYGGCERCHQADPQGPSPGPPVRPAVRGLQERGPVTALTGEPARWQRSGATALRRLRRLLVAVAVMAAVVVVDQLTKWWAVTGWPRARST